MVAGEQVTVPERRNPAFVAYLMLRTGFAMAPVLFGLDKFFNWMVDWPEYLAPWIDDILPGSAQDFMYVVGVIEIGAGLIVLTAPWIGGFVVAGTTRHEAPFNELRFMPGAAGQSPRA